MVSLLDSDGNAVRYAESLQKGIGEAEVAETMGSMGRMDNHAALRFRNPDLPGFEKNKALSCGYRQGFSLFQRNQSQTVGDWLADVLAFIRLDEAIGTHP